MSLFIAAPAQATSQNLVAHAMSIGSPRAMLVDEARNQIYFADSNYANIDITDLTGTLRASVAVAISDFTFSPDGSQLIVAESSKDDIVAIDLTTYQVTTVATGIDRVSSVASAASKIWYSYGCNTQDCVGSIDMSTSPATVTPGLLTIAAQQVPMLAAGSATSNVLVVSRYAPDSPHIATYDLSSGTPTLMADRGNCIAVGRNDVFASGAEVLTYCGDGTTAPLAGTYRTSDLSTDQQYAGDLYDLSVTPDGSYVAFAPRETDGYHDPIDVIPTSQPSNPTFTGNVDAVSPYPDSMQITSSGTLYLAVETDVSKPDVLYVLNGATLSPANLSVTAPSSVALDHLLTITGKLLSSRSPIAGGQTISVSRRDATGTVSLPSLTAASDGSYTLTDHPASGPAATYVLSWAGDSAHRPVSATATLSIARPAPLLTVSTTHSIYPQGARAYVTVHLGPTASNRHVSVYYDVTGFAQKLLVAGDVNSLGNIAAATPMLTRRTNFTAIYAGDDRDAPETVVRSVAVRAKLVASLARWYGHSGSYALYRTSVHPVEYAQLYPNLGGSCLYFRAQIYLRGAWRPLAKSACIRLNPYGVAGAILITRPLVGIPYRLNATYYGSYTSAAAVVGWLNLRFT